MVVSPRRTLRQPSSRSDLMPAATAACLRTCVGARSVAIIPLPAARDADSIFHFAAQVAVTTSVSDPRNDFEINALGTFNTLEAARASSKNPIFVFSSTNKVYGGMEDVTVVEQATRYAYRDLPGGVSEAQPLDFVGNNAGLWMFRQILDGYELQGPRERANRITKLVRLPRSAGISARHNGHDDPSDGLLHLPVVRRWA